MKKTCVLLLLPLLGSLALFSGCRTGDLNTFPDRSVESDEDEEVTIWIEEIRKDDGVEVLGYLEKRQLIEGDVSGERHAYIVYDEDYNDIYEGMILDDGTSYKHTSNGELSRIGITGIKNGVQTILNYDNNVTFYRDGRQIFHESK